MTRRLLVLLALLVALVAPGQAEAQGGDTTAVAINTKDDSSLFKFAFAIKKVTGEVVDNTNAAVAYASCENCRTTAISIQIVLVSGSPGTVVPENFAISINENCTLCQTFSTAFQFVIGVEDPSVGLTKEGKRQLREILREFKALKREEYTLEEFHARTQALGQRLRTLLRTELQSRRPGDPDDDDDAVTRALLCLAGALVLAGCGGESGPAGPALDETAANLDEIERAVMHMVVRLDPDDGDDFGYEIEGPIELAAEGAFPRADVRYRQFANGEEETVRLVLTEDGGWVEREGERTDLTEAQLAELRESGSLLGQGGLETLNFEQWLSDAKLSDGPEGTDKVTGELDVAAAMAGLAALSGVLPEDVVLTAEQRQQVADAVEDSSFELLTGDEDRLLRKLALGFELGEDVPEDLRDAIGQDTVGAAFTFELELDDVNEPVSIGR